MSHLPLLISESSFCMFMAIILQINENGGITWNGTSTNTKSDQLKPLRRPFPIHTAE